MRRLALLFASALAACGVEEAPLSPSRGTSPLETTFEAAAREYQVPVGLLKAVAWVETRVSNVAPGANPAGGVGLMQLSSRDDWNLAARAAALTGVDGARLALDERANLRGAAAVLRELFDRTARDDASLEAREAGDWYRAVALYPGIESAPLAQDYAAQVMRRLEQGFTVTRAGGTVVLAPGAPRWQRHAPAVEARRDALGDYPGIAAYTQSPNHYTGRTSYEFIVIHTTQGSYSGTISWFLNTASQVSANYVVRSSDGQITQMVSDADGAWHAECYNRRSIGIEHEGFVADPATWYTDAMYSESAALTRWLADRHGIPKDRSHIIGHVEVAPSCNTGGHTDPGTGWDWTRYMALVLNQTPTPSTGVLVGLIYTQGNSANRVAGATVQVNGQTVTTASDGLYQFTLAPGSYTATVSLPGYGGTSVTRTVTSGAQVWGSMEINAVAPATGTLQGKVYVYDAANPSDTSQGIAGAEVQVNGQSQAVDSAGNWSFTLAPGTYTVTATAAGYAPAQQTRTVASGAVVWGSVGLTSSSSPDVQPPTLVVTSPTDQGGLDLAALQVRGTASDDRGAVSTVQLVVNGAAPVDVAVSGGQFSQDVTLVPGLNTLTVSATDAAGNSRSATVTTTFHAGLGGVVHLQGDDASRIAGATVLLVEPGTGNRLATATTDSSGVFGLDVAVVPASFVLVVTAPGFLSHSETITLPADRRLSTSIGLVAGEDPVQMQGLSFVDPKDGATVGTDTVSVYGTVQGFDPLAVRVNGVAAELLGGGSFVATVPLTEGDNTLEATATGALGQSVTARLTVKRVSSNSGAVTGGCSAGVGVEGWLLALLCPLWLSRRRATSRT